MGDGNCVGVCVLVEGSQWLELGVLLARRRIDERVRAALTRLHVVQLDIANPDLRPRVLVERRAAGNDEVGAEAVDAQRFATVTRVVFSARSRHDHERVRVVVCHLHSHTMASMNDVRKRVW